MKNTFQKGEKLKSRKLIEQLFMEGKRLKSYPIQLVYLQADHDSDYLVQASFSVPKRRFKKAVDRNKIKRLMRESYRLHKSRLYTQESKKHTNKYVFMFIYMSDSIIPYKKVENHIKDLIQKFIEKYNL